MQDCKIVEEPDRGPDGGRDFIIIEHRAGNLGVSEIKWLVSCKHFAHSGSSVNVGDEEDIPGRVKQFQCNGFIAFYSTICSSALSRKINAYKDEFEICIYDREKIERELLKSPKGISLIQRFFPNTYEREYKHKEVMVHFGQSMILFKENLLKVYMKYNMCKNLILKFIFLSIQNTFRYDFRKRGEHIWQRKTMIFL